MRKLVQAGLWFLQVALMLMFLAAGGGKFGQSAWPRMFAHWGYPDRFYLVIGTIEVIAGLALVVPRTAAPAALTLLVIMIGAGITHLTHNEAHRLPQILVMSTMLALVAYGRWSSAFRRRTRP
jgi:putative oxidoreductase